MRVLFLKDCGVYKKGDVVNMEGRRALQYIASRKPNKNAANPVVLESVAIKKTGKPQHSPKTKGK